MDEACITATVGIGCRSNRVGSGVDSALAGTLRELARVLRGEGEGVAEVITDREVVVYGVISGD